MEDVIAHTCHDVNGGLAKPPFQLNMNKWSQLIIDVDVIAYPCP